MSPPLKEELKRAKEDLKFAGGQGETA